MTTFRIWGGARVVSEDPLTVELPGTQHTHLQLDRGTSSAFGGSALQSTGDATITVGSAANAVTVSGLVQQGAPLGGSKLTLVLNGASSATVESPPPPGLVPVDGNTRWLRVEIGSDDVVSLSPSSGMLPFSASALEGASTIDVYADDSGDPEPTAPV